MVVEGEWRASALRHTGVRVSHFEELACRRPFELFHSFVLSHMYCRIASRSNGASGRQWREGYGTVVHCHDILAHGKGRGWRIVQITVVFRRASTADRVDDCEGARCGEEYTL